MSNEIRIRAADLRFFTAIIRVYLLTGLFRGIHLKRVSSPRGGYRPLRLHGEAKRESGVLAILVFSVLLGNLHRIAKSRKIFSERVTDYLGEMEAGLRGVRAMQGMMSFLVKNFLMGVMFDAEVVNRELGAVTLALIVLVFVSQFTTASLLRLRIKT